MKKVQLNILHKILALLLLLTGFLSAQELLITGTLRDSTDNALCIGANIKLKKVLAEQNPSYTTTNNKGYFEFLSVKPSRYLLEITFVGYNKYSDTIRIGRRNFNLGNIIMV